jgi:hypothetical protein
VIVLQATYLLLNILRKPLKIRMICDAVRGSNPHEVAVGGF